MQSFFEAMFAEMGARRRRMRAGLGDRGQGIAEFLLLGGLMVGSLGLLVRPWMPSAAPWGFAVPLLFLAGYALIEARRQASNARGGDPESVSRTYDWITLGWSFACALLGVAAFVIAWSAQPLPPPPEQIWTPPEGSVPVDISP
ncbi:MAG: hypothetical protein JNM59_13170 [Hyphomonadaceae bacterium]|nr:hypothetical protein [Hyphomonadaceae bacterium]